MVADTKKVQTLINRMADVVEKMRDAETIKAAYIAAAPDITNTPLEGNIAAVNAWLSDLTDLANSPVAQGFIDAKVPSHRGEAL